VKIGMRTILPSLFFSARRFCDSRRLLQGIDLGHRLVASCLSLHALDLYLSSHSRHPALLVFVHASIGVLRREDTLSRISNDRPRESVPYPCRSEKTSLSISSLCASLSKLSRSAALARLVGGASGDPERPFGVSAIVCVL